MSLNFYKMLTQDLCNKKGWDASSIESVWMFFTEEVGELASAIRRSKGIYQDNKKFKIEDEMGDVFSYLFQLAFMLNIDLDTMWNNHHKKALRKRYKQSNFFQNQTYCPKTRQVSNFIN